MELTKRCYTVWLFKSPTSGEENTVVLVSEPNDLQVQHSYQQVLWRGLAWNKADALSFAK